MAKATEFPEPCLFDRCQSDWVIKPLGVNTHDVEFYAFTDTQIGERFIFEVNRYVATFVAKNLYGKELFKGVCQDNKCDCFHLVTMDQKFGEINSAALIDNSSDHNYICVNNQDSSFSIYGPFPLGQPVPSDLTSLEPAVNIRWDGTQMLVERQTNSVNIESNFAKALFAVKALHLTITDYYPALNLGSYDHQCLAMERNVTSFFGGLIDLTKVVLLRNRVLIGNSFHHYLEHANPCALALVFESDGSGRLTVVDKKGSYQFYAVDIRDQDMKVRVNLHDQILLGSVQNGLFVDDVTAKIMEVKEISTSDNIRLKIENCDGEIVCEVNSDDRGVHLSISDEMHVVPKAILLAYVFKIAYYHYPFQSMSKTRLNYYKSGQFSPYAFDMRYITSTNFCMASITLLSTGKLVLRKVGHKLDSGITYFEVKEVGLPYPVSGEKLILILEAAENVYDVEATGFDLFRVPAFSIYGAWAMDYDMMIKGINMIGLIRQGNFFDENNKKLMVEQVSKCQSTNKVIYRLYNAKAKHPSSSQSGKPQNLQSQLESMSLASTSGASNLSGDEALADALVAEITGDEQEVSIQLFDWRQYNSERVVLIISYALKLAYNVFKMHTTRVPEKEYKYSSPFTFW